MTNVMYVITLIGIGLLAFFLGAKLTSLRRKKSSSTTSTFIITSFRKIAEFAAMEYVTESITDINEKTVGLIFARWKKGLLRYKAKIKVGFDMEQARYHIDNAKRVIQVTLPKPKVIACEIYDKKFYMLPLEGAEKAPAKINISQDFTSAEILGLEELAKKNARRTLDEFGMVDSNIGKMKLMVREFLSPQLPEHTIEMLVSETESSQPAQNVLEEKSSDNKSSNSHNQ